MSQTVKLSRTLGLFDAVWIGLGSIFGTGLFIAMGLGAQVAGGWVIAAVLIAFVCAACNGLASASLAAAHPVAGGTYAYGRRFLSPTIGFSAGVLFLVAKSASAATGAQLVGLFVLDAINVGYGEVERRVAAVAVVAVITGVVLAGARRSAMVNAVIVAITLIGLGAWAASGVEDVQNFVSGGGSALAGVGGATGVGVWHVLTAASLVFVAYTGYGRMATLGEEVRDPSRVIPRAVVITLAGSMVAYLLAAVLEASGARAIAVPETLGVVVSVGIGVAVLGSALNLVLGLSRVVLAMSRDHELPSVFSRTKKNEAGEPARAVIAVGVLIALLTLIGDLSVSWRLAAASVLGYYAIANLAALRLDPKTAREHRRYCAPKLVPIIGLVMCIGLGLMAGWEAVLASIGALAAAAIGRKLFKPH